jgi:hypothetical protein
MINDQLVMTNLELLFNKSPKAIPCWDLVIGHWDFVRDMK